MGVRRSCLNVKGWIKLQLFWAKGVERERQMARWSCLATPTLTFFKLDGWLVYLKESGKRETGDKRMQSQWEKVIVRNLGIRVERQWDVPVSLDRITSSIYHSICGTFEVICLTHCTCTCTHMTLLKSLSESSADLIKLIGLIDLINSVPLPKLTFVNQPINKIVRDTHFQSFYLESHHFKVRVNPTHKI